MKKSSYHDDDIDSEIFSEVYPTYNTVDIDNLEPEDQFENDYSRKEVFVDNEIPSDEPVKDEPLTDEEINVNPTPLYTSFEQIKKELVVLDLERQIAWEELVSLKHEFKEDLAPSNFVEPAIKVVGAVSGFVLLKNLIFGR